MESPEQRLPPSDAKAERAAIGAMLRDNTRIADVAAIIRADDFYAYGHRRLFETLCDMAAKGKPADPVTLADELKSRGLIEDIGGYAYIIQLWDDAPSIGNAGEYAKIIASKSTLRNAILAAGEIQAEANAPGADAEMVLAKAESLIFDLAAKRVGGKQAVEWKDAVRRTIERLDRRAGRHPEEVESAIMTPWRSLNDVTGGMHRRELVILAARPSVGKTLAALNIADYAAAEGCRILLCSIEQGDEELVERLLSKHSRVSSYRFRTADFRDMDTAAIDDAIKKIESYPIMVNSSSAQSVVSITSDARRMAMRGGLDMIIIDYLQLMSSETRTANRNEEIGRMTRGLKRLAKDLNIVVVCLAQLNRNNENRLDKRPRLADLRDSGEIEQDADTVFMLHKPEDKDAARETDMLMWLIEKQRNGPCGEVTLDHHRPTFTIREIVH